MTKWQWNGGVERKQNLLLRECWTFLIYIFLHQQWKQCLEFLLAKLREICKYLAGACNSNSHARGLHYLTFVCKTKQGNKRNEASRLRNVSKELSIINSLRMRRSLLANWIHYIAAKKPQPLCENWNEKGIGEKMNCGHRLIQHMVYRGVSTQLPLIKIIGILILQLTLFILLFPRCFFPVHFSQYPLPKKCTLFFLPVINPKSFLPLFPLL